MKLKRIGRIALYTFTVMAFIVASAHAGQPDANQHIVKFKPGKSAHGKSAFKAKGGELVRDMVGMNDVSVFKGSPQAIEAMRHNPNIDYIEPDVPRYPSGEGEDGTENTYGIYMHQANLLGAGSNDRTVCIIDSGFSKQHVDLQNSNVTASPDSGTGDPYYDDNGHGTHVGGTIAALANNQGVRGVVADGSLNLHIVKVFTADGWAYSSSLADAAQGLCR